MSKLYLAATPIGNLEDVTYRVIRVLKTVPLIAAEDTRKTSLLLKEYQVQTPLIAYHDHNKDHQTAVLLDHLAAGDLALVTDAGTPAVNDPGYTLVRAAIDAGHTVIPLPGPSAPITALSASGLPSDAFLFLGYLPRKAKQRRDLLRKYRDFPHTLIFLETPHRLLVSLEDLQAVLGDRQAAVARELTKLHEEIFRGTTAAALAHFGKGQVRGEITLVLEGAGDEPRKWNREKLLAAVQQGARDGSLPPSKLAKKLAEKSGWPRREIYELLQKD